MKLLSYSSGYDPCGVADYNRHLTAALDGAVEVETTTYPTKRVARHQVRQLLALRRGYAALAARSDAHDVVLMHFASKYWNGGRPVENMLPLFLKRVRKPIVMVLHEWPSLVGVNNHAGPLRLAKSLVTSALVARDLGRDEYRDWNERRMFERVDHIVVHTPEFRERLIAAGVDAGRITVLPFPIHAPRTPSWTASEVEEKFGLRGKRALLLLGLPVARKGFTVAVEALRELPSDVVLLLVCSERKDNERAAVEELRTAAREHGVADRLITTGYLDDAQLSSVYQVVQLALAPFTSVSGSSSIANFFAAGVPVLTTALPPMQKALADGAGVSLFVPGDPHDLARAINAAIAAPSELTRMRDLNVRYAAQHSFSQLATVIRRLATAASEHGAR